MEYKIIGTKGIIVTRRPEAISDNLYITFTGAPDNATAIFKTETGSHYRQLQDGTCSVATKLLTTETEVVLTVLNGQANPTVYKCEGLKVQTFKNGDKFVVPNDNDLPQVVADIQVELQATNDKVSELETKLTELETKFEDMLEGYDIV